MKHRQRILVVEDDPRLSRLLSEELTEAGYRVRRAGTVEEAEPQLEGWAPDLVISDVRLPGSPGLALLDSTRSVDPPAGLLLITAFGSVSQAVDALKAGADDFLTKPLDLDHLKVCVKRILETRELRLEVRRFRNFEEVEDFHGMVGKSPPMLRLFQQIRRLAEARGPVLIEGESGAGKELVARAVRRESSRSGGPFVAVNCAGIPEALLESEFFGHRAGAFTGATRDRKGLFLESEGGTLLLDEVAEMPLALQAKLLRVLEDGLVRRVGGAKEKRVDVRVLVSTNRDLEKEVAQGRFREDLFYRLETFRLRVPSLRERREDIPLLSAFFLRRLQVAGEADVKGLSPEAADVLDEYEFPGNVRELKNAIERAVTFCDGDEILPHHLPSRLRMTVSGTGRQPTAEKPDIPRSLLDSDILPTLAELERRYLNYVLERVGGNKRRAAALLGIGRKTLYRRLAERPE